MLKSNILAGQSLKKLQFLNADLKWVQWIKAKEEALKNIIEVVNNGKNKYRK